MDRVLLVDDEENVLRAYKRTLRSKFSVDIANCGRQALEIIEANGAYPVIVSDMRMPEMNGVELLSEVKQRYPETVRILLTGNADQETAVAAINEGDVFRFLNKPCTPDELGAGISAGVEHHRLLCAERHLLENTLKGAVTAIVELISLVRPDVLGQTMRLKQQLKTFSEQLNAPIEDWQLETAGLLSQLGYTTLTPSMVEKAQSGQKLLAEEETKLVQAIDLAAGLIEKIPRLESVSEIIRFQDKHFDGTGHPREASGGASIPLGSRILKCLLDYDRAMARELSKREAISYMERNSHRYDPEIFEIFKASLSVEKKYPVQSVPIGTLRPTMILADDVTTKSGLLVVPKGLEASPSVRSHLSRFLESGQIDDGVLVHERV